MAHISGSIDVAHARGTWEGMDNGHEDQAEWGGYSYL